MSAAAVLRIGRLDVTIGPGRVALAGRLDEASPLGDVIARVPPGDVAIDTAGVVFLNSVGMREWMRFVRALAGRGAVTLERVADVLMTQLHLVPDLATRVRIASFHAPYECPRCGAEATPLIDAVAHAAELAALRAPPVACTECGAPMALADFPERYLGVFRGAPAGAR